MSGCRAICEDCGISKDAWQIGTTKVFIRHPETVKICFNFSIIFFFSNQSINQTNLFLFSFFSFLNKVMGFRTFERKILA